MNCKTCNSYLEPHARFCGVCGTSVADNTTVSGENYAMPGAAGMPGMPGTAQATGTPGWGRPMEAMTSFPPQQPPMPLGVSPLPLSQQGYPGQNQYSEPTISFSANGQASQQKKRRGPGVGGCFLRMAIVLVLLVAALAGVWFFALQPTLHNMVMNKLDTAMGQAVDKIPSLNQIPITPPIPLPIPIPQQNKQLPPITENMLDTVMGAALSPSDPVKDPAFQITEQNVTLTFNFQPDFLPFAVPCTVSFVPTVNDQGQVVVQNVQIQGAANLIVSPSDIQDLLNKHLADAMQKLNNPISSIQLQQGAIVLTLK